MKKLLSILLVALGMTTFSMAQNAKEAEVKIKTSAVCGMCKKTIEKAMSYEKGVQSASLDVDSKMLTIVYNPKKTNIDKLRTSVSKTGYDADNIMADPKAYNQLDECCKKEAHTGESDPHAH